MANVLIAPENEEFPQRKRWTRQECYQLMKEGKLTGRWELIDGEILSKMGQKPPHSVTLNLIAQWLITIFGFPRIRIQEPITIPGQAGRTNEPEPDIAVTLEPTTAYADHHPAPSDLHLVVEVSDTTLRFDLTTKARLYARAGVQEYWVADVLGRQLHCHRTPTPAGYSEVVICNQAHTISLPSHPDVSVRFGDLLPPETPISQGS
jgi:Uma2 family endonuclease